MTIFLNYSALISNIVSIDRYKPLKQALWESLIVFKRAKGFKTKECGKCWLTISDNMLSATNSDSSGTMNQVLRIESYKGKPVLLQNKLMEKLAIALCLLARDDSSLGNTSLHRWCMVQVTSMEWPGVKSEMYAHWQVTLSVSHFLR